MHADARKARDHDWAANRPAAEFVVSLGIDVGDFGDQLSVINPHTWKTLVVRMTMHTIMKVTVLYIKEGCI